MGVVNVSVPATQVFFFIDTLSNNQLDRAIEGIITFMLFMVTFQIDSFTETPLNILYSTL